MSRKLTLVALLALLAAGCEEFDLGIPPNIPEQRYATPRAVTLAIDRDQARAALARCFSRARTPLGRVVSVQLGPERFQFGWAFPLTGYEQRHDFDFAYAEVAPRIVDLSTVGGRTGVKFTRGGEDVPYAYVATATGEDAETILDCFAVLAKPAR